MTDSVVVEGYARLRDGKKWKTRWLVFRKPSPVADCLVLLVFKDKSDKLQGNKEKGIVTLEQICGLELGQWYEGVSFTLAILCLNQAALLGFDSREALQAWELRLRYSLGEVHRFSVGVLPGTRLETGPATLHLCNNLLALIRDFPPVIIGHWNLPDLRRYGPVPNGFVFEGGTRCGYWAGVFLLASAEGEQISFLLDCIVRGICPSRGPYGLRPILPGLVGGNDYFQTANGFSIMREEPILNCWIRNDIAFYVAVVAYFCVIFLFNFIMFIVVLVQLHRIKKQNPHNNKHRSTLQDVRSVLGITLLLGLTWGFAFFAWGPVNLAFMYLFAIFNSLQGFFIFVFHCLVKETVRRQWRTYLCCGKMRLSENSEWSRTATQKNTKKSPLTSFTSSQSSRPSSTSFLPRTPSLQMNGIGNPLEDRIITADEEPRTDVVLNEINSQLRNRRGS